MRRFKRDTTREAESLMFGARPSYDMQIMQSEDARTEALVSQEAQVDMSEMRPGADAGAASETEIA